MTALTRHNEAVFEDECRELMAAADQLEGLAARTTGGDWRVGGLLASRPEVIAEWPGGAVEHVAEARANTADWITTLSPAVAEPMAAWLRSAAEAAPITPPALAFARALTSRRR